MNATVTLLLAAFFLPLFPFSVVFNALFSVIRNSLLRTVILLAWPQIGVTVLASLETPISPWIALLALATSILYGFRALVLCELGIWTSFLATSSWALLWIAAYHGVAMPVLHFYALGFSVPFVLLALLTAALERRFGAAYAGLHGGLAQVVPRLSGVLVFVVLAVIATPVFPAFFMMLSTIVISVPATPAVAVGVVGSWLIWSWAGARLLQGVIVGPGREDKVRDLSLGVTWMYTLVLVILVVAGLGWMEGVP